MTTQRWSALILGALLVGSATAGDIPEIQQIGNPVFLDGFNGSRPDVACDALGQPHAVVEDLNKGNPVWHFYDKVGSQWRLSTFNLLNHYSSGDEFGNPHVEVSNEGVAWYSGRMSSLRTPLGWGMGMVVRTAMTSNPGANQYFFRDLHGTKTPLGDVSLDPSVANRASTMIQQGPYKTYQFNPTAGTFSDVGNGRLNLGNGGEKVAFRISHANSSSANTWHGCTEQFYVNSKLGASLVWANWNSYPSMWDDGCYPGLGTDSENTDIAYMACDYKLAGYPPYGIYINIYNPTVSGNMAFGHDPLQVDPNGTSGLRRFPPRWAPAKGGGAWLVWVRNDILRLRYIPADLKRDYPGQPYAESLAKCGPEITIGAGNRPAIATDGDGNIHLVYLNSGGMRYRMLTVNPAAASATLRPVDMDGDGEDDVVMYDSAAAIFRVRATTDGKFDFPFGQPGDVAVPADYDSGSPQANYAVFRPSTGQWIVRPDGGGANAVHAIGDEQSVPVPADYDGDGNADPAVMDSETFLWSIRKSTTGVITQKQHGIAGDLPVPGDFNKDGKDDITVYRPANYTWYSYIGSGPVTERIWGWKGDIPAPADFDGDGFDDFTVFRPSNASWHIKPSTGAPKITTTWGGGSDRPAPGMYDGDAKADVAVYRENASTWHIRRSTDGTMVSEAPVNYGWPAALDVPMARPFQNSNGVNVAVWRPVNATWYIRNLSNNAPGFTVPWGAMTDWPVPHDYDGDGLFDIASLRPMDNGTPFVWRVKPSGGGAAIVQQFGWTGDQAVPGDYDGDGAADFAVYRKSSITRGNAYWYIKGSTAGRIDQPFGWYGDQPIPADYDGDGTTDVAVYRPSSVTGGQAIWYLRRSTAGGAAYGFGWYGDKPVPADYDGDGKVDIAVYRPSTGGWYIRSSITGAGLPVKTLGKPGDIPVPADYDFDGKTDIGVYRKGDWWIRQSSDGELMVGRGAITWGLPGEVAIGAWATPQY